MQVINIKDTTMKISGLNPTPAFAFPAMEKDESTAASVPSHDVVSLSSTNLLADDEVDGVLDDTIGMIGLDPMSALSVHSGLSESRVAALLSL